MRWKGAPATALLFICLPACAPHSAPVRISGCRLDGTPVTLTYDTARRGDGILHLSQRSWRAVTIHATLKNDAEKAVVSTRFRYSYRYFGAHHSEWPAMWDNYWRIPPHHVAHLKAYMGIGVSQRRSQSMECGLYAVNFEDGTSWASEPGAIASGEADRHHGPL